MSTDRDLMKIIDSAAKLSTSGAWQQSTPVRERYEAAWSACAVAAVEYVYDHNEMPHASLLVADGMKAIAREVWHLTSDHGLNPNNERGHARYWWDIDQNSGVRADSGLERIALWQVMDQLTAEHREALTALAVTGSTAAGADAVGLSYGGFAKRARDARIAFYRAWFNPETAPVPPQSRVRAALATHCKRGHERSPWNVRRSGECITCEKGRTIRKGAA